MFFPIVNLNFTFLRDLFSDSFAKQSSDMEPLDFEALLRVIGVEAVAERDKRVANLLCGVNWAAVKKFCVEKFLKS